MVKKLLIATTNAHKALELAALLGDVPFQITTPQEEGISLDVEETGSTFEENASLKAQAFAHASGLLSLADDSGIEVDALGGAPGIYSSRYAGPGATDEDRVQFLIEKLRNVPVEERQGRFRCVVAVADPEGGGIAISGDRGRRHRLPAGRIERLRLRPHLPSA